MATIKDIAKRANVSVSTVSYALNGGPRNVPTEVRERIFQIAKELEYRPNSLAKSMVTGKTNVLGVVAPEVVNDMAAGPFFGQVLNAIVNECEVSGQDVLLFTRISSLNSNESIFNLIDGRCDGLIFIAPNEDSHGVTFLHKIGFPHVVINGLSHGAATFNVDNRTGVRLVVDHFYNQGHRKIVHLAGPSKLVDATQRKDAFIERMTELGLTTNQDNVMPCDFNQASGYQAGLEVMSRADRPTAVCCGNDEIAVGLYRACRELGLSIPEDVSITGFDDIFLSAQCVPGLTTVKQPITEISLAATKELLHQVAHTTRSVANQFAPELIVRGSTQCPKEDKP